MFDKKSFLIELIRNDMTMKSLANAMCINPMTLSRKVKGERLSVPGTLFCIHETSSSRAAEIT
jgi:hypothetical protein